MLLLNALSYILGLILLTTVYLARLFTFNRAVFIDLSIYDRIQAQKCYGAITIWLLLREIVRLVNYITIAN